MPKDPYQRPALHISHVVEGRHRVGTRVRYLLDESGKFVVPETVVLQRWRKRLSKDCRYHGVRLNPHVWRALALALGKRCEQWAKKVSKEKLKQARCDLQLGIGVPAPSDSKNRPKESAPDKQTLQRKNTARQRTSGDLGRAYANSLPNCETVEALLDLCGVNCLQSLVDRHSRKEVFGVPDLFLFARHQHTGRRSAARFVEVKKPGELLSADQLSELDFMAQLGLKVRVLRLIERNRRVKAKPVEKKKRMDQAARRALKFRGVSTQEKR